MIRTLFALAIAASATRLVAPVLRDTNSAAQVRRGIAQYDKKQHDQALQAFDGAAKLHPGPLASFNLGTAHIAAGHLTKGSEVLSKATEDPALRADAYYNRGNSALAANALDYAIRDYVAALKARPGDMEAKRNLEIALLRRQASRRPQPQRQTQPMPQQEQKDEQEDPQRQDRAGEQKEQTDPEALLRSVEQQEREELSRMRRARAEPRRIGW